MRGLTDLERAALSAPAGDLSFPLTYRDLLPLEKRGLVVLEHHRTHGEYSCTPQAALALRLDTAARAMGVPDGR